MEPRSGDNNQQAFGWRWRKDYSPRETARVCGLNTFTTALGRAEDRRKVSKRVNTALSTSIDSRNKVVSFRLSDSEYALAQELCKACGYRGMSVLARSALLSFKPLNDTASDSETQTPEFLQARLRCLVLELSQLIASLSDLREDLIGNGQRQ